MTFTCGPYTTCTPSPRLMTPAAPVALELAFVYQRAIVHRHAQAGGAAVDVTDVRGAAQTCCNLRRALVVTRRTGCGAGLLALLAGVIVALV